MTLQTPPSPGNDPVQFGSVVADALVQLGAYKKTHLHAYDIGIRARSLVRYASGDMEDQERASFQSLIAKSPWAIKAVVKIVKDRRAGVGPPTLPEDDIAALKALA